MKAQNRAKAAAVKLFSILSFVFLVGTLNAAVSWDGSSGTQLVSNAGGISEVPPISAAVASVSPKGKVLIVFSSQDKITLKDHVVHPTGFFLSEFMIPLRKLIAAGYEPVFANPKGNRPVMDKVSDTDFWFGDTPTASPEDKSRAQQEYQEVREQCEELGICGEGLIGSRYPITLIQAISGGLDQYAGLLVPGGHAPMEDLLKDPNMGAILRYFHGEGKPTALICHGPIALLSGLEEPDVYITALETGDTAAMKAVSQGWIYNAYSMTVFTTAEEQQEEPGQDDTLGGFVKFYPDTALENAGGHVVQAAKWNSNVVVDRELITGQNPFSDEALGDALVQALDDRKNAK